MSVAMAPAVVAARLGEDRHDIMTKGYCVCPSAGETEQDGQSCEEANHALKETAEITRRCVLDSALSCCLQLLLISVEGDESLVLLIPEPVVHAFEAGHGQERFHVMEHRVRIVTALKIVVRNARTEMVNVVETDVSGKPLEHFG